jgi:outer membrane protein OmpA-like peptidoglycan-associated protein
LIFSVVSIEKEREMRKPLVLAGLLLLIVGSALAQDDTFPKVETSPAFMYIRTPISFTLPGGTSVSQSFNCAGGGGTLAYNFTRVVGIAADLGGCKYFGQTVPAPISSNVDGTAFTFLFGPRLTFRNKSPFTPFAEVNFGGMRISLTCNNNSANICPGSPSYSKSAFALTAGGGFDIRLSKKFSLRPVQAEYLYTRFGNDCALTVCTFNNNQNSFRLKSGIVIGWGGSEAPPPAASCSVQPSEVFLGEPITATVTASNFNAKHTVTYAWSGNGGQITGKETSAQIDTTNAAPGSYTVNARVTDTKEKKNNEASCWANFTVKALPPKNPPAVSISASPSSLQAGGVANLSARCTSPDRVAVSVANWTASDGTVSGTGNSAMLNTTGAAPGSITVNATCTDTRGLATQASTQVMVASPPPVQNELEVRLALHSVYFVVNQPLPGKPNGGLLASQQKTLISLADDFKKYLATKPDAHLILSGHADHRGSAEFNQALSERRVERVKSFLVEQGVPEANIETKAFGKEDNLTTEEVQGEVESNTDLSPEERERILKNIVIIRMASNRRVDVTLSTTGQTSIRRFPFNAADALTLIGGREAEKKAAKPAPNNP